MIRALDGIAVLSYGIDLGGPGRWHLPTTAAGHPDLTWYDPNHPELTFDDQAAIRLSPLSAARLRTQSDDIHDQLTRIHQAITDRWQIRFVAYGSHPAPHWVLAAHETTRTAREGLADLPLTDLITHQMLWDARLQAALQCLAITTPSTPSWQLGALAP